MTSKAELRKMLFSRLAELQDGRIKVQNPPMAKRLSIELNLLYEILEDDIEEEWWEQIEAEI